MRRRRLANMIMMIKLVRKKMLRVAVVNENLSRFMVEMITMNRDASQK